MITLLLLEHVCIYVFLQAKLKTNIINIVPSSTTLYRKWAIGYMEIICKWVTDGGQDYFLLYLFSGIHYWKSIHWQKVNSQKIKEAKVTMENESVGVELLASKQYNVLFCWTEIYVSWSLERVEYDGLDDQKIVKIQEVVKWPHQ